MPAQGPSTQRPSIFHSEPEESSINKSPERLSEITSIAERLTSEVSAGGDIGNLAAQLLNVKDKKNPQAVSIALRQLALEAAKLPEGDQVALELMTLANQTALTPAQVTASAAEDVRITVLFACRRLAER